MIAVLTPGVWYVIRDHDETCEDINTHCQGIDLSLMLYDLLLCSPTQSATVLVNKWPGMWNVLFQHLHITRTQERSRDCVWEQLLFVIRASETFVHITFSSCYNIRTLSSNNVTPRAWHWRDDVMRQKSLIDHFLFSVINKRARDFHKTYSQHHEAVAFLLIKSEYIKWYNGV